MDPKFDGTNKICNTKLRFQILETLPNYSVELLGELILIVALRKNVIAEAVNEVSGLTECHSFYSILLYIVSDLNFQAGCMAILLALEESPSFSSLLILAAIIRKQHIHIHLQFVPKEHSSKEREMVYLKRFTSGFFLTCTQKKTQILHHHFKSNITKVPKFSFSSFIQSYTCRYAMLYMQCIRDMIFVIAKISFQYKEKLERYI